MALRKGRARPTLVVDVKGVGELAPGIEERDGWLRIGASTPITRVLRDPRVRGRFPALAEGAEVVGSIQIRNRATLAGNLANASPAADTAPPLLAHGAELELAGTDGGRRVPLDGFFTGPGRTVLAPGELVAAVLLPLDRGPVGARFERMTRRRGVDLATVSVCCAVATDGPVTFAFGAVGPRPLVVRDTSGVLADPAADPAARDVALRALTAAASPISNVRASREYRAAMLDVLARRALETAHARLREAAGGR